MSGIVSHRFGFVMEQTLGHVAHYKNMRAAVDGQPDIEATWYPLGFAPRGVLETLPPMRGNWSMRASLRARKLLARDDAAAHYDALFFHTQVTTLLSTGLIQRVPSVVSLDATPRNYDAIGVAYGHEPSNALAERLKLELNRRPLHAARALVTWCDWARRSLINDYGVPSERIAVIAPGVNLELWPCPTDRDEASPVRMLFVGGDFWRKGGEALLAAFTTLRARGDLDLELHIVTKGDVSPGPGVFVYRDVEPNSDLLKRLYATADVFVLPTLADCFPLVVQEAMAAGLPVVASDVGAISEAVSDGQSGFLVRSGDVPALASALMTLAHDWARRRTMGHYGRERAERMFDSAANARRVVGIMVDISKG